MATFRVEWFVGHLMGTGHRPGRWGVAPRKPTHEVTFRNQWGTPPGFEVPEPLWRPDDDSDRDRTGEIVIW